MTPNIITKQSLLSTNTTLAELLEACPQLAEGTVVRAIEQEKGRGQIGNSWESEGGKNLTFSVLLRPSFLPVANHFYISMVVALSVVDFLRKGGVEGSSVKWPNDVYIGDRKVCGILIENTICGMEIETCIAGIGININQTKFVSDAPNPVSLCQATGRTFDLEECLDSFLCILTKRYEMLRTSKFAAIKDDYISLLYRYNEDAKYWVRESGEETMGRIEDVRNDGVLVMRNVLSGEILTFLFKEIEFVH